MERRSTSPPRTAEPDWRELNRRLRLAFLSGAEAHSRRALGRPLTRDELPRVLGRYPGDLPER